MLFCIIYVKNQFPKEVGWWPYPASKPSHFVHICTEVGGSWKSYVHAYTSNARWSNFSGVVFYGDSESDNRFLLLPTAKLFRGTKCPFANAQLALAYARSYCFFVQHPGDLKLGALTKLDSAHSLDAVFITAYDKADHLWQKHTQRVVGVLKNLNWKGQVVLRFICKLHITCWT